MLSRVEPASVAPVLTDRSLDLLLAGTWYILHTLSNMDCISLDKASNQNRLHFQFRKSRHIHKIRILAATEHVVFVGSIIFTVRKVQIASVFVKAAFKDRSMRPTTVHQKLSAQTDPYEHKRSLHKGLSDAFLWVRTVSSVCLSRIKKFFTDRLHTLYFLWTRLAH